MPDESAVTPESLAALFAKHNIRPIRQEHLCDWGTAYAAGADVLGILCVERYGGDVADARDVLKAAGIFAAAVGKPLVAVLAWLWDSDAGFLRGLDKGWVEGAPADVRGSGPFALGARVGAEAARRLMPAPVEAVEAERARAREV